MVIDVHGDLVKAGTLVPVEVGGAEERSFLDWDLANLAENRLGDLTDPRELDEARRADWRARAAEEPAWRLGERSRYERCYWVLDGGERVGTIAIANDTLGSSSLRVSSFYVLSAYRGRGLGRRTLGRVQAALAARGLGLRLETSWCWQRAVQFYLGTGMWIYMWKRDLAFCWSAATPRPRIDIDESTASLSVPLADGDVVLARARRRGDVLELDEPPEARALQKDERLGDAYWRATSTLSLALALRGWPLVRSQEAWERCRYADGGPPEALARKIVIWEAWNRKHGWLVQTPRIAGVAYPSWEELEARWTAEARADGLLPEEG